PGYFAAMGVPLLRGRTFASDQKLDRANEVIISEAFAERFFPGEDPLGKHLRIMNGNPLDANKPHEIVGVVGDTRYEIGQTPLPMEYFPLFGGDDNGGALVIRSSHDVESLAVPIQKIIQSMDRDLPVSDVLTMNQVVGRSTLDQSFDVALITGF